MIPTARVGGGMTAPRAGIGGESPVAWIKAMGSLRPRLDAYAHHPYPARPQLETPWAPACRTCASIAMADLERLVTLVHQQLGRKRIWLTEYGYQTNPPDMFLGVSPTTHAQHVASAARRVELARFVDMLIFFLVRDDEDGDGWQSGFTTADGEEARVQRFPLPAGADVAKRRDGRPLGTDPPAQRAAVLSPANSAKRRLELARRNARDECARRALRQGACPAGSVVQLWSVRDRAPSLGIRV